MSQKLNFTYVVVEPADGQWGVARGGQWNGMIRWRLQVKSTAFFVSKN